MPEGIEICPMQSRGAQMLVSASHLRNLKCVSLAEEVYGSRIKECCLESDRLPTVERKGCMSVPRSDAAHICARAT